MMIEKESGVVGNATFPSIWELDPHTGTATKSVNNVDKMDIEDPDKRDADTVIGSLVTVKSLPKQRIVVFLLM